MKKVLSLLMATTLAITLLCVANVKAAEPVTCGADQAKVTIHFQKFAGAYEGAAIYNWIGLKQATPVKDQNTFEFTGTDYSGVDDFGAYITVCADKTVTNAETGETTPVQLGAIGEIIVFSHSMPAGTTNLSDWSALNAPDGGRVGYDGHNLAFDGAKYNAALATGEVHLWYVENMFLEATAMKGETKINFEMAVSDGTAEAMAAAKFEATKYWEGDAVVHDKWKGVANATLSGKHGYAQEGLNTITVVLAHPEQALFDKDGNDAYQMWQWGIGLTQPYKVAADDSVDMATDMFAVYRGVKNHYGVWYLNYDPATLGADPGFKFRSYGGWTAETNNFQGGDFLAYWNEMKAAASNFTVALLWGQKTSDYRFGNEGVAEWVAEINGMKVGSAEFSTRKNFIMEVTKQIPTAAVLTKDANDNDIINPSFFKVTCDGEEVAIAKVLGDTRSATIVKFNVELNEAIDPSKTYNVYFGVTLDGTLFEANRDIDCDNEAPTLEGRQSIAVAMCSGVVVFPNLTISDAKDGTIYQFEILSGEGHNTIVDTTKVGAYVVTFAAYDKMGNQGTLDVTFNVVDTAAGSSNANAGLALLGLLPAAVVGLVAFRKFSM